MTKCGMHGTLLMLPQIDTTASARTFNLTELAEGIFLQLPPNQILTRVQRVCHHWKAVVEKSTPIQQALFFEPIPSEPIHDTAMLNNQHWATVASPTTPVKLVEHRLIGMRSTHSGVWPRAEDVAYPQASWRRQLLTQPPIASCLVHDNIDGRLEVMPSRKINGAEDKIVMEQVFGDRLQDFWAYGVLEIVDSWEHWDHNDDPNETASQLLCRLKDPRGWWMVD